MRTTSLSLAISLGAALAACSSQDSGAADAAPRAAPAPFQATRSYSFDNDAAGQPPPGWKVEGTRSGQGGSGAGLALWAVVADVTAPSAPNALGLTASTHGEQDTYNLCWTDGTKFENGRMRVALKAVSGNVDQGGGPMWRVQDRDNYYVCRVNPLESNFRVYRVTGGLRTQLDSEIVDVDAGSWYVIDVVVDGPRITCTLDGEATLMATDDGLSDAGGVGLWTKADAVTNFDDLEVQELD
jgi:hypothetical protein